MDERATDKAEAWQKNCMAILGNGEIAVCIKPGPWHGWLFEKHPDGQWVSVEKLQTGPMTPEGHPLATLSAIPAAQGERAGLTAESAAALAGKMAIEEAARVCETPYAGEQDDITMGAKDRAAARIRSLSPALDRNALIERGARALYDNARPKFFRKEDARQPWEQLPDMAREHWKAEACAILSEWIGEETK